jgi:hypothetical protein
MNIKEILGPVRSNKKERIEQLFRSNKRQEMKNIAITNFGPDKGLLHQYRLGNISRSSLKAMPLKRYEPIVKDDINPFKKNKEFMKTKKLGLDSEFFK